jgi:hypothetical protein
MAFCPHCGKSVGDQATRCAECGGELEPRGKPARFKGTMMMSPGTAPLIQPPNAGQPRTTQPASQPGAPAPAPAALTPSAAIAATLPMPAAGPIAEAAAAAAAKKPAALKATMLGTGEGLGGIAQKLGAQPKAEVPARPEPQAAPLAAAPAAPAAPAPQPQPAAVTRREAPPQEEDDDSRLDDSKRFLVGDPMAPSGTSSSGGKPQRGSRLSTDIPRDRSATFIVVGIIGVCVIAAIGYAAARLLGIAN